MLESLFGTGLVGGPAGLVMSLVGKLFKEGREELQLRRKLKVAKVMGDYDVLKTSIQSQDVATSRAGPKVVAIIALQRPIMTYILLLGLFVLALPYSIAMWQGILLPDEMPMMTRVWVELAAKANAWWWGDRAFGTADEKRR